MPLALHNRKTKRNERYFSQFATLCSNLQFRYVFILIVKNDIYSDINAHYIKTGLEDDCFCQSKTFKYACNVRRVKFIEKRLYRLSLQQTYVSCIIFSLDKKLLCICLNDSVELRERKLPVTIGRLRNCAELLRFASRRTTLCKCSNFLGNSKIDN